MNKVNKKFYDDLLKAFDNQPMLEGLFIEKLLSFKDVVKIIRILQEEIDELEKDILELEKELDENKKKQRIKANGSKRKSLSTSGSKSDMAKG